MVEIKKEKYYFVNLDALRFLASWGVLASHTIAIDSNISGTNWGIDVILTIFSFPYFGVSIFFTLSSFLITYRIFEEYTHKGNIEIKRFYFNRCLRIWPIYFLMILAYFFAIPLILKALSLKPITLPPIFPFLAFYSNFYMIQNGNNFIFGLTVFWSLAVEEQFYFTWGLLLNFLRKYFAVIVVSMWILSIGLTYYLLQWCKVTVEDLRINTFHSLTYLCSGSLIAFISIYRKKFFYTLLNCNRLWFLLVYILLIISNGTLMHSFLKMNFIAQSVINSILFSLIVFEQSFRANPIIKLGFSKLVNYFGKISYGIYVYHAFIICIFLRFFKFPIVGKEPLLSSIGVTILIFVFTIMLSHLSYQYFEKIFLKLKK